MMTNESIALLQLLRHDLNGHHTAMPTSYDMSKVMELAFNHHVTALALDGASLMGLTASTDTTTRLKWIALTSLTEEVYLRHLSIAKKLNSLMKQNGLKMAILKGLSVGANYPTPCHRECGDIDIFVWDATAATHTSAYQKADRLISEHFKTRVDTLHEHHSVIHINDITIENHYDFINTVDLKGSATTEQELKTLFFKSQQKIDIGGMLIDTPNNDFNVAFLSRHMGRHFSGMGINLRQIIDWGQFLKVNHQHIDWQHVIQFWKATNLTSFVEGINRFCVEQLGYDPTIFHNILLTNNSLYAMIENEVINPRYAEWDTVGKKHTALYRFRRFVYNGWKRKITTNETNLSAFMSLTKAHCVRWIDNRKSQQ